EFEVRVAGEMIDVLHRARHEVVDRNHAMVARQQEIHQVRSQEAGASGHDGSGWGTGSAARLALRHGALVCGNRPGLAIVALKIHFRLHSFVIVSSRFRSARQSNAHAAALCRLTSGGIVLGSVTATLMAAAVRSSKYRYCSSQN